MARKNPAPFLLGCAALLLTLISAASSAPPPAATPPAPALLSPAAFAQLPALNTPLDAAHLDVPLLAAAIFHETNRIRRELHLRPFQWLAQLDQAADLQAGSGALNQAAGHENFLPALETLGDRIRHVGLEFGRIAENSALLPLVDIDVTHEIAVRREGDRRLLVDGATGRIGEPHTYASFAAAAVKAWMNSPGHRANIVNPAFHHLGCSGRSTLRLNTAEMIACVQVFYTPPGEP